MMVASCTLLITCDCDGHRPGLWDQSTITGVDLQACRRLARREGWRITHTNQAVCPSCKKRGLKPGLDAEARQIVAALLGGTATPLG